mmetsp:Transcript_35174/g.111166  ORF Transcript_35174/g.111166 Transcript_35174/m.111166 type:complete len:294 (-) Transcript_35174:41-922(-)
MDNNEEVPGGGPLHVVDGPLLAVHPALLGPVRGQEVQVLLSVVALVGLVDVAARKHQDRGASRVPIERHAARLEEAAAGEGLGRLLLPGTDLELGVVVDAHARGGAFDLRDVACHEGLAAGCEGRSAHAIQAELPGNLGEVGGGVVHVHLVGNEADGSGLVIRELHAGPVVPLEGLLKGLEDALPRGAVPHLKVLLAVVFPGRRLRPRGDEGALGRPRECHGVGHRQAAQLGHGVGIMDSHLVSPGSSDERPILVVLHLRRQEALGFLGRDIARGAVMEGHALGGLKEKGALG